MSLPSKNRRLEIRCNDLRNCGRQSGEVLPIGLHVLLQQQGAGLFPLQASKLSGTKECEARLLLNAWGRIAHGDLQCKEFIV